MSCVFFPQQRKLGVYSHSKGSGAGRSRSEGTLSTNGFYIQQLSHRYISLCADQLLHSGLFSQSSVYAEQLLHTEALTQRGLYTEKHLRTEVFTRKLYTEKLLHREASKQSIFYTQKHLHTHTKALHTCLYTQTLLRMFTEQGLDRAAFTHRSFYTERGLCTEQLIQSYTHRNFKHANAQAFTQTGLYT